MSGPAQTSVSASVVECADSTPGDVVARKGAGSTAHDGDRPLRRDAERNRARILAAAAELFAEQGLDVGVDEIARRAGVGMGTLYRRFPNKDALVDAILRTVVEESRSVAQEALATQPAAEALRWFVIQTVDIRAVDEGSVQHVFLSNRLWTGRMHELMYDQVVPLMERMFDNARRAGTIRDDVAFTDVLVLLRALRGVIDVTEPVSPGSWHRHLQLLFDGLHPRAAAERLEPGPIDFDTYQYASQRQRQTVQ
jgi:AcrR family transcriptional regulator